MILLTPAYPCQNSTPSVNEYSLKVLVDEFKRGYKIIQEIKNGKPVYKKFINILQNWNKLIEPIDFFYKYYHYLAIEITANEDNLSKWLGYCESKLRKFVELLGETGLFDKIHLHPIEYKNPNIIGVNTEFFIGLELKSGNENIDISIAIDKFYYLIDKTSRTGYKNQTEDMKLEIKYYEAKNLPTYLKLDFTKVMIRKINLNTSNSNAVDKANKAPKKETVKIKVEYEKDQNKGKDLKSSGMKRKPLPLKKKKTEDIWKKMKKE